MKDDIKTKIKKVFSYVFIDGLTGAGIGVGVAVKYKEPPFVTISAAIAGLIGAFASKILQGSVLVDWTNDNHYRSVIF